MMQHVADDFLAGEAMRAVRTSEVRALSSG